ncbi:MAG: PAS domain S-box protein [Bacteroidetes bacterium]|nr:PAS domain S-box protein [Bacteroidota bacterium]
MSAPTKIKARRIPLKKAIADLQKNCKAIIESGPDAFLSVDEDGIILMLNRKAEELFQYDTNEIVGKKIETLIPERLHDRHISHIKKYQINPIARPMGAGLTLFARKKDNSEFPVDVSLNYIQIDTGLIILCAVRDITDRKKMDVVFHGLASEVAAKTGQDFFNSLVIHLTKTLDVDIAFIGKISAENEQQINTIAECQDDQIVSNFNYDLKDTPCLNVVGNKFCYYPENVQSLFSKDELLKELSAESYAGAPLYYSMKNRLV